ncbi:hypothetical protein HRbin21_00871 [bacterium HR21]|nr:hypothetical protein HRbin21_00871 [bacterium HR21]
MWRQGIWVVVASILAWGQSLELLRDDGGPLFLTAGERVRLTIRVAGHLLLGGGCRLAYSPPAVLSFAGWEPADFSRGQTLVIAGVDTASAEGWVDVSALSLGVGRDTLRLATLEFVVSAEAAHGSIVQFRTAQGWVLGIDSLSVLSPVTLTLPVHGYVEVWPGDANDDGVVDTRDVAVVGLYAYRATSGYRRVPASVEWLPQRVRAWAEPPATYADCDGNGIVTVRDLAVVLQNYGMSRTGTLVHAGEPAGQEPTGPCLFRGYIPPEAAVVVGIYVPCAGSSLTGVRFSGAVPVIFVGDSLCAFACTSTGGGVVEVFGDGQVCYAEVEYRTRSGEWRRLELSGLGVSEPEAAALRMGVQDGQVWVEGWRRSPGWLCVYTLLGQELVRFPVPPGSGHWSAALPSGSTAPWVLLYRTAFGVWRSLVVVPEVHRR